MTECNSAASIGERDATTPGSVSVLARALSLQVAPAGQDRLLNAVRSVRGLHWFGDHSRRVGERTAASRGGALVAATWHLRGARSTGDPLAIHGQRRRTNARDSFPDVRRDLRGRPQMLPTHGTATISTGGPATARPRLEGDALSDGSMPRAKRRMKCRTLTTANGGAGPRRRFVQSRPLTIWSLHDDEVISPSRTGPYVRRAMDLTGIDRLTLESGANAYRSWRDIGDGATLGRRVADVDCQGTARRIPAKSQRGMGSGLGRSGRSHGAVLDEPGSVRPALEAGSLGVSAERHRCDEHGSRSRTDRRTRRNNAGDRDRRVERRAQTETRDV